MVIVFEDYRGFDISDKIQALKITKENINEVWAFLAKELPNSRIDLSDILGAPKLRWTHNNVNYGARVNDYLIKDPADGYLPISGHVFDKSFARDI